MGDRYTEATECLMGIFGCNSRVELLRSLLRMKCDDCCVRRVCTYLARHTTCGKECAKIVEREIKEGHQ